MLLYGQSLFGRAFQPDYVLPGLPAGCVGVISGDAGVGKTFFALQLAVATASTNNNAFAESLGLTRDQRGVPTLYVGGHDSREILHYRLALIRQAFCPQEMPDRLAVYAPKPNGMPIQPDYDTFSFSDVEEAIGTPRLVIVDLFEPPPAYPDPEAEADPTKAPYEHPHHNVLFDDMPRYLAKLTPGAAIIYVAGPSDLPRFVASARALDIVLKRPDDASTRASVVEVSGVTLYARPTWLDPAASTTYTRSPTGVLSPRAAPAHS